MLYQPEFITLKEEAELLLVLKDLPFREAQYLQYTAKRRVVSYGLEYDYGAHDLKQAPPVPEFLGRLRERAAAWIGIPASELAHALINEYRPGTQLGWHRDRPEFGVVTGISLGGNARMRFRRYPPRPREKSFVLELAPCSAYILRDEARWKWQHSIAPTPGLRYSITFRSLRSA